METLITLKNLSIGYNKEILTNINLEIKKNEYISIIGPNGAGKSTLVKTILSVIPPIKGKITTKKDLITSYVAQRNTISDNFPLTAFDVALMGIYKVKFFDKIKQVDKDFVIKKFKELDITHLLKKQYSKLSGGEKQKVLIAKALSSNPDILILDEPTNAMDLVSENNILNILKDLNKKTEITIIMITHHLLHIGDEVSNVIFVNKDNNTFFSGTKEEIFKQEKLSILYNKNIEFKTGFKVIIGE